jgi:hypothetical protein
MAHAAPADAVPAERWMKQGALAAAAAAAASTTAVAALQNAAAVAAVEKAAAAAVEKAAAELAVAGAGANRGRAEHQAAAQRIVPCFAASLLPPNRC